LSSCGDDVIKKEPAVYDSTPYDLEYSWFPEPEISNDNKLTNAKVQLGRMLFYEPALSKDLSQSCATCHVQEDGFSDKNKLSLGVRGLEGRRQAMPIVNMAWHENGFFWDGRATLLRDQALKPIQDELEMDETLENVIAKLSNMEIYTDQFKRAFDSEEIDELKISLALEQFMNTITSFDSKFDKVIQGQAMYTPSEKRGRDLFFNEFDPVTGGGGAECFHCHGGFNFTNDQYMNNGLDSEANFSDLGRHEVTENEMDKAKFKTPTLRNITKTAPYMHDGRFETLEEVIEHYNSGVKPSPTTAFILQFNINPGLQLTNQDKIDLINFLKTLEDEVNLNDERHSNPFK
jgi:cytochrome c peroxidase